MKILNLHIQGFRSLYDVEWQPGDLNIIIGPNGSGKSNLLRTLEMLALSASGKLSQQVLREGGMEPLLWDSKVTKLQFEILCTPLDPTRDVQRDSMTYVLELVRLGSSSAYRIDHEILGNFHLYRQGIKPKPLIFLERSSSSAVIYDDQENRLAASEELVPQEESLLSLAAGPFTINKYIPMYQGWLSHWLIYHDFQTCQGAQARQPAIARMETAITPDGSNLVQVLHTLYESSRDFRQELNLAMKAAFGDDFDELNFPPAADQRVQLRLRWKSLIHSQSTADLSDGTLRFLFLIAILSNPNPPPLIAIDEPETGLHPSMLPIIAEYAKNASKRTQVILTTHSPELLDALSEFSPTITTAKWVDGKTHLDVLSGESLKYWLKEYTLGKLYRSGELEDLS